MHLAACIFPTAYSIRPGDLATALEERGFESLWVAEHSHIPVERVSPWPGGPDMPQMYYDTLDPFLALTAAAGVTTDLKLGTGICLMIERDPITTAKEVASLDMLSRGRFIFGIGGGWNAEEMANHGTDPSRRFGLLRERIEAMKAIWAADGAEYHGAQVDFDPIHQNPKPVQVPHPPIHVGGVFPGGLERAVRYGNGWIPIAGRGEAGFDPAAVVAQRNEACERAGRDPAEVEVSIYYAPADAAVLDDLGDHGIERAAFAVPSAPRDEVLPLLAEVSDRDPVPLLARHARQAGAAAALLDGLVVDVDATDAHSVAALPSDLARLVLRRWLTDRLEGRPPDAAAVDRVLAVAAGTDRAAEVAGGLRVERSGGRLRAVPVGGATDGGR